MLADDEVSTLRLAFDVDARCLREHADANVAEVVARCDEAAGADRYRFELSTDVDIDETQADRSAHELAEAWRDLGYSVELLEGEDVTDRALFAQLGDVRVSAVFGLLDDGRVRIGLSGSTGCHRR